MRYVHLVEERYRPIPAEVIGAAGAETDPDARILAMLAARTTAAPEQQTTAQRGPLRSV